MLSLSSIPLVFLQISGIYLQLCNAHVYTFEMHHRYSEQVKVWSQQNDHLHPDSHHQQPEYYHHLHHRWPKKGSFEYYSDLALRDRVLRGRKISELHQQAEEPLTFSDGNSTFRISSLGFLHYTTVTLGTPGVKFLVALDTGSDLFWVPCDCSRCAPIEGASYAYGADFELSIYNPKASSTSSKVSCNNTMCLHRNKCIGSFSHCPYVISYVSAETSTSGILVEDVMHLKTEDHHPESIEAFITFGCGQVQTGSFLDVAAPNGLFGLGMENISVPSILSREGFIADSFSMCFGRDGVGRISFGDKGSPDQKETPFNVNPLHPSYNVTMTQIQVGTVLNDVEFTALFDSGTSFTYLVDPFYTMLASNFDLQVKDKRRTADSRIPFEFCYDMRPDANTSLVPTVSISMKGGGQFRVYDPIIVISTESEFVYCLAVVRSSELSIIGHQIRGFWNNRCDILACSSLADSSHTSLLISYLLLHSFNGKERKDKMQYNNNGSRRRWANSLTELGLASRINLMRRKSSPSFYVATITALTSLTMPWCTRNCRAEEIRGLAIRELDWKRADFVISTKIFLGGAGPNDKGLSWKHIIKDTKASLKSPYVLFLMV